MCTLVSQVFRVPPLRGLCPYLSKFQSGLDNWWQVKINSFFRTQKMCVCVKQVQVISTSCLVKFCTRLMDEIWLFADDSYLEEKLSGAVDSTLDDERFQYIYIYIYMCVCVCVYE